MNWQPAIVVLMCSALLSNAVYHDGTKPFELGRVASPTLEMAYIRKALEGTQHGGNPGTIEKRFAS